MTGAGHAATPPPAAAATKRRLPFRAGALMGLALTYRRPAVVALHLMVIALANYMAFDLRFEGFMPAEQFLNFVVMLPWLLVIRGFIFLPCGLYQGMWRYTGIWDLRNIVVAAVMSTAVFVALTRWVFGLTTYPRSVFVIDTLLLIMFVGGIRISRRVYRELRGRRVRRRLLVYGAGDAGEMVVRDMRQNRSYEYEPVGFVDDDPAKAGRRIHGVRVLGGRRDLYRIFEKAAPAAVLIAMPGATVAAIREVVAALEPFRVPIKTLPNLRNIVDKVDLGQIRNLSVEDLLDRAPVGLGDDRVRHLMAGQRVMVTGAGGSIGSELCRQIAARRPASLIMFERYENSLYAIANELAEDVENGVAHTVVGDVTDAARVNAVMSEYRPDIVFHAAAHKHVPLMELNPCEAVKNNVMGTRVMTKAAATHGVKRFILISTDKAVNPSSVMGATKRVAELLLPVAGSTQCVFTAVRFGNVLGSNGSVLPRFLRQIETGGPVTVTHPEVRRYFMLIPEAVQLVLHAAALGGGGDTFVLEMGEQIKVVDMARNVIRLSGFVPEQEVPITFIGLRPGEKLYEELIGHDETAEASEVPEIRRVRPLRRADRARILAGVAELEGRALSGDPKAVIEQLREIVPTYRPAGYEA